MKVHGEIVMTRIVMSMALAFAMLTGPVAWSAEAPTPSGKRLPVEIRPVGTGGEAATAKKTPEARLEAATKAFEGIEKLAKDGRRAAAYERGLAFRKTYAEDDVEGIVALLERLAPLMADLETDVAVAGLAARRPPDRDRVVDAFLDHVRALPHVSEAAAEVLRLRMEEALRDPAFLGDAMTEGLAEIYPDFAKALGAVLAEDTEAALRLLAPLGEGGDPYLAAHAAYFAGRAHLMDERYEAAVPPLAKAAGEWMDRTLLAGEALFLLGLAQGECLEREAGARILRDFLTHYPNAPERMRVGAYNILLTFEALEDGSLADVHDRMDDSRRRLKLRWSGDETRAHQDRILVLLQKLIEEAEREEQDGGGGGGGGGGGAQGGAGSSGTPSGNQVSGGPAAQSSAPVGEARMGALHRARRGRADEVWGNVRQREREEVLNVLRTKFPERYRKLLEQYYRSLQEESP